MTAAVVTHRRVSILACDIDALTCAETLAEVDRLIQEGRPVQHCVINASKAVLMQTDHRLRDIVNSCELVNADGQSVVWASRLLGRSVPERVAGVDLFVSLMALAERRGYGVYFLGATSEVVDGVVARAQREHPHLRVCGSHDGYLRAGDTAIVIERVRATQPHILFVGMPSPRKEYWLSENLEALGVPFCMGVGGSFDVYAGKTRRAPLWMQHAGLEWFYRFSREPRRMWRRYLFGNAAFLRLVGDEYRADRTAGRRSIDHGPAAHGGRRSTDRTPEAQRAVEAVDTAPTAAPGQTGSPRIRHRGPV